METRKVHDGSDDMLCTRVGNKSEMISDLRDSINTFCLI